MTVERRFAHANNPGFECSRDVILLPFGRRSYLRAIVEAHQGKELILDETTDRLVYELFGSAEGVTLLYSGMGGPAAANALEMAAANGARRVILFGACGGTHPALGIGDLLVVEAAVRGEGTSRYYAPPDFPASFDPMLVSALWDSASQSGAVPVHRGVVYTTDAGYRQGPEIYEAYQDLIVGVESECAAAAVVGARLGLEMASLLFCTDNITLPREADRAYRGLQDRRVLRGFEAGLAVVLEALTPI